MEVRVLFFGVLKDLAGRSSDLISLPDHACAADVLGHYQPSLPSINGMLSSIAISVNQEYATPDTRLHSGDEIALLPPVSGGAHDDPKSGLSQKTETGSFITREKIDAAGLLELLKRPEDGALLMFEGVVRNHSRGRRTLFLDYEAYEAMALKQMESLIVEACAQFKVRDALIVHRLGRIEIGETSVLIIVASAHRAAAFDACRWIIDTLKRTVPIWKKEHFEDGAIWSDGEPFPEQINQPSKNVERRVHTPVPGKSSAAQQPATARKGSHSKNSASNSIAHK
jgi:molybdopterin synthase catalytic subunit/molybdopterin converting factor small subunit